MKAATNANVPFKLSRRFQSTPPVKAATLDARAAQHNSYAFQSTPPVKAATLLEAFDGHVRLISIHAAREGGDVCKPQRANQQAGFQSTPPVKAATISNGNAKITRTFQSTPPVKAATHVCFILMPAYGISIHAAREGGDFWSKLPMPESRISIHAAREGGDPVVSTEKSQAKDFNPRRP